MNRQQVAWLELGPCEGLRALQGADFPKNEPIFLFLIKVCIIESMLIYSGFR